jgi:hypothetical protein
VKGMGHYEKSSPGQGFNVQAVGYPSLCLNICLAKGNLWLNIKFSIKPVC